MQRQSDDPSDPRRTWRELRLRVKGGNKEGDGAGRLGRFNHLRQPDETLVAHSLRRQDEPQAHDRR